MSEFRIFKINDWCYRLGLRSGDKYFCGFLKFHSFEDCENFLKRHYGNEYVIENLQDKEDFGGKND